MKTKTLFIFTIIASLAIGYFFGSHDVYIGEKDSYIYNVRNALNHEREYCNAWMELAHWYLYDNPPVCIECVGDSSDYARECENYWDECVMDSKEFQKIDSLNGGDWEDWYCKWDE